MRWRAADPATYGSALVPTPPVSTAAGANKTTDSTAATAVVARLSRAPATSAFQLACMTAAQRTSTRAPADTAPEYERGPGEPPPGGGSRRSRASRPRSAPDAREPSRAKDAGSDACSAAERPRTPPRERTQRSRASRPRAAPDAREPSRANDAGSMPARQVSDRGRRHATARSRQEWSGSFMEAVSGALI